MLAASIASALTSCIASSTARLATLLNVGGITGIPAATPAASEACTQYPHPTLAALQRRRTGQPQCNRQQDCGYAHRLARGLLSGFIGTAGEAGLDDIADAVGLGDQERLDRALADTAGQGLEGIPVLRAVQRHFQRLHGVAVAVRGGRDPAGAVAALRPPVFYQRKAGFERQAARWNLERVELALRRLGEAELACKTTGN